MNTLITIKQTIKALIDALHFSYIIPAASLILGINYFVLPIFVDVEFSFEDQRVLTVIIGLSLFISYFLFTFNYYLIRLLEGYPWKETSFGQLLIEKHKYRRYNLIKKGRKEAIEIFYPRKNEILPTKFGNIIAASETYSDKRYGMDAIVLWPRILPILLNHKFNEFMAQKKTSMDLYMNMMYISIVLSSIMVFSYVFAHQYSLAAYTMIIGVIAISFFYYTSIITAIGWGMTIRVTFDIFKEQLKSTLNIKKHRTLKEEQNNWKEHCKFFKYGEETDNLFNYPS